MSRDSRNTSKQTLIDRRTYLRAAAGATAITALAQTASASEEDFDVIEVPAGETRTISVGDGETFENKLIDITADRAAVRFIIDTDSASTTVVRNVGIRGQFNHNDYNGNAIVVRARHPDGEIIFDNIYWADGCESNPEPNDDPSGASVRPSHAGHVEFNRVNFQGFPDNAIYASPAGHHSDHPAGPSAGGRVDVRNSYFKDNMTSDIRLGTDGMIENCVCLDNPHRALWANQHIDDEGQYVVDSDFATADGRDIAIGNNNWDGGQHNWVEVENTRFEESRVHLYNSGNELRGSSAGAPKRRGPEDVGAPTSAEAAASGSTDPADEPAEEASSGDDDPSPPEGDFTLELSSADGVSEYLLELDAATIEAGDGANTHDHEYQDRAFEHDGLWYVHGYVGDGGVDDFDVEDGEILRVGALQGSPRLRAGREELDVEAFDSIESVPSSDDDYRTLELAGQFEYRIEVSGEIRPAEEHAQWLTEGESYGDDWAEWWLSGADGARTVWEFTGEITTLELDDYDGETEIRTLAVDGEELDHEEFVENDGPHALELAGQFEYRVEVSGEIRPSEEHAQWLTEGESYGDDWAEWWLSGADGARTVWEFTGEITTLELDDHDGETEIRTLTVDGEEIDPDDYR